MTTFETQSTDIIGAGLDFNANDEVLTIAANVLVAGYDPRGDGVASGWSGSSLINYGSIFSSMQLGAGVVFAGDGASLFNGASASIAGNYDGVLMDGNGAAIDNRGSIIGYALYGVFFDFFTENIFLQNLGIIYGHSYGVGIGALNSGGFLFNAGSIRADFQGILVYTGSAFTTSITNTATGIIKGGNEGIDVGGGMLSLTNHGMVIGGILDTAGLHDVIINPGKIQGSIHFGGGNDVFNGKGGTSGPIFCGGGNDRIIGGNGNVSIHVGGGYDTLTAGPGHDRFIFDSLLMGVEKITNFTPVLDKIVLSETYFPGLGPHGTLTAGHFHVGPTVPPNPHIIYTPGNGFLYYDADGTARGTTHFATLTTHPVIHNTDFIVIA